MEEWLQLLQAAKDINSAWQQAKVHMLNTSKYCFVPTGLTTRFAEAIAKCEAELDLSKWTL